MKAILFSFLAIVSLVLVSCGSPAVPESNLSVSERSLLTAINAHRATQGQKALAPLTDLTEIARKDAKRRATTGDSYVDHRGKTGYERMLTMAGTAKAGPDFGAKLMNSWKNNPVQSKWLEGNHSGVGVGTATKENGLETGVLILGGFEMGCTFIEVTKRDNLSSRSRHLSCIISAVASERRRSTRMRSDKQATLGWSEP